MKVLINKAIVAYSEGRLVGTLLRFSIFRARLLKFKCLELLGFKYAKTYYGVKMLMNWNDGTFKCYAVGVFGRALSDYIKNIKKDFIFLDIGANQGLYSLLAAANKNCKSVLAFEPVADIFEILKKNISFNLFSSKIHPLNAAISSKKGRAKIFLFNNHSGKSTLDAAVAEEAMHSTEEVQVIDIKDVDELISELTPKPMDIFIKIDVEGHEDVVIEELLKSKYFNSINAIFYEMDERWNDPVAIRERLEEGGFSKFIKHGDGEHYDVLAQR